jgi:hypothetical protein
MVGAERRRLPPMVGKEWVGGELLFGAEKSREICESVFCIDIKYKIRFFSAASFRLREGMHIVNTACILPAKNAHLPPFAE